MARKKAPERKKANRGPAVAKENRKALLVAARELLAERGYDVPLSAIAERAGVGQATMYRNFPTRTDLGRAVFAEDIDHVVEIAATPDEYSFERIWRHLVRAVVQNASLVEYFVSEKSSFSDGETPVRGALAQTLALSRVARDLSGLTVDDLTKTIAMVWGVLSLRMRGSDREADAHRALELVDPILARIAFDDDTPGGADFTAAT